MHKSKNRFISFMLSCLTVFSLASPVMAENETIYPTFDESRTGSITLYKYVSNDGKTVLTDGTSFSKSEEDNFNQIQAATGSIGETDSGIRRDFPKFTAAYQRIGTA